ncbi:hypothetical protein COV15_02465 [Candidatus Woesearchaeota archaeon CG10_big_fil_rev_8_21_14_0_10_34_12]|nr:MAG: hypothetical protein COV15_02465 [Candidatus Woesearchaeota archaeon CG10_big_fil_rev_8_21_14_0_10_34_12]
MEQNNRRLIVYNRDRNNYEARKFNKSIMGWFPVGKSYALKGIAGLLDSGEEFLIDSSCLENLDLWCFIDDRFPGLLAIDTINHAI